LPPVDESPLLRGKKGTKFLEMAEKGMLKRKELAEKAKLRQMEKKGEIKPDKSPIRSPMKRREMDTKVDLKKKEMDTRIDPVPKHVPKIGGLRISKSKEPVPRFTKLKEDPSPGLRSSKSSLKIKKDSTAPSFKVPELEVIKEYPKFNPSPIKFIDGNKK
jgi:hypothetical protein